MVFKADASADMGCQTFIFLMFLEMALKKQDNVFVKNET